jgi:glycerate-2-kinase
MSRLKSIDSLIVGGEPRVDLLPPEVRAERRAKRMRRSLAYGVLGLAVVVVIATGGTSLLALNSQVQLAAEQARTGVLLAQQAKFLDVRKVQDQVKLIEAAQQVGASTEIDWQAYLNSVQSTLPANVTITTVKIDSASPLAVYAQPTAPLQGARVATLSFTASSPTLPQVPVWLDALATLKGFADAVPGSVALDTTTNTYTVNITMHINEAAFEKRFAAKGK